MVHHWMVLGPVVRFVGRARPPVVSKLALGVAASEPVEAHVHRFEGLGEDYVGEDPVRGGIVGLDGGPRLSVAHFHEGCADGNGRFGVDEQRP